MTFCFIALFKLFGCGGGKQVKKWFLITIYECCASFFVATIGINCECRKTVSMLARERMGYTRVGWENLVPGIMRCYSDERNLIRFLCIYYYIFYFFRYVHYLIVNFFSILRK
jgi:hypothetical protein